jgi:hypothetical protein
MWEQDQSRAAQFGIQLSHQGLQAYTSITAVATQVQYGTHGYDMQGFNKDGYDKYGEQPGCSPLPSWASGSCMPSTANLHIPTSLDRSLNCMEARLCW